MITDTDTIDRALRLDGNAVAGELQMLLNLDVTVLQMTCSHCHKEGIFANLLAYVRGPGLVLRCPTCEGLILQLVKAPSGAILTVEGITADIKSTIIP
ncbi:DUF6510 family protein [Spirosoma endbachense]|uniref:Hydrogenase maturation nickel metallochaperone HypA n=1 Tax=Spirosoma endbachense TaxID=2666025 RepID=A0A6P1W1F3_9BACT|nr:DUF6510 family protein [Spirosoma endbachense]QHV98724.1 hypothetical protein GJR95_28605 [Spirosoma endbachense]